MVDNSERAKKIRDKLLAKNPNYYKELRAKRTDYSSAPKFDTVSAKEAANKRWAKREDNDSRLNPSEKEQS